MEDSKNNSISCNAIAYLDWYFGFGEGSEDLKACESWGIVEELIRIMKDKLDDDGK